jgi:hypothetical protein
VSAILVWMTTFSGDADGSERLPRTRPPMRNRVTPMGTIEPIELRGAWLGNRGILHRDKEIVRFHASNLWIICELEFRGWRAPQWEPHHYTALFFHDEAVALAAGHRPCALCRRASYRAYREAYASVAGGAIASAKEADRRLHDERLVRGTHTRRFHEMNWGELPDGSFVRAQDTCALVLGAALVDWSYTGYVRAVPRPRRGRAQVITPPMTVAALLGGYAPQIDAEAYRLAGADSLAGMHSA